MENVSVLIRVKNEERWVGHAIQSALDHLQSPEIIVIDNNSTDSSLEIVKSFRHNPALEKSQKRYTNVSILSIDEYSPGKSLNMGVAHAQFENILILSAHCIIHSMPDPQYLSDILSRYGCVFGKQVPVYNGRKITPRYLWSHFGDEQVINMYSSSEERYFMHNAFSFFKKSVLTNIPFDENVIGKEDRIWAKTYVENSFEYLYSPECIATHHYTQNGNTWKGVG